MYILAILAYIHFQTSIIKALPCLILFANTQNIAFLFAAFGDYFLDQDMLLPGLFSFGLSNIILFPVEPLDPIVMIPFLLIQPIIFYTFGMIGFIVDLYVFTLLNMLSRKTIPTTLFIISDIFVLLQFLGLQVSFISLPLYWFSMLQFSEINFFSV